MEKKKRHLITFELPESIFNALREEAEARGSTSHHQRAREILVEFFANNQTQDLRLRIDDVSQEVVYLGELVRRTAYSVIVHAASHSSDDANAWIREHMPRTRD